MEIEYQDIITLSDNNKYVVASKVNYKDAKYVYLVDIYNNSNIKFAEIEKDNSLSELDSKIDKKLIIELIPLFYNSSIKDIEIVSAKGN
ncbi:MAG: hypothetical protein VZS44_00685 [Bacilli bacterium]|nr:hypothetical protein [Bacilli bacterium]